MSANQFRQSVRALQQHCTAATGLTCPAAPETVVVWMTTIVQLLHTHSLYAALSVCVLLLQARACVRCLRLSLRLRVSSEVSMHCTVQAWVPCRALASPRLQCWHKVRVLGFHSDMGVCRSGCCVGCTVDLSTEPLVTCSHRLRVAVATPVDTLQVQSA